jgi:hypothetical protein
MPGGVAGEERRLSPLCRLETPTGLAPEVRFSIVCDFFSKRLGIKVYFAEFA